MTFRRVAYIQIHCEPAGQPRAMPVKSGSFGRMVMDWKFRDGPHKGEYRPAYHFRQAVKTAFMLAAEPAPLSCAVKLTVWAYFTRPKSMMGPKYPDGPFPKLTKPDADNILKLVQDGINDAGLFWTDDCIVFEPHLIRRWAAKDSAPCAWVLVEAAEDEQGELFGCASACNASATGSVEGN